MDRTEVKGQQMMRGTKQRGWKCVENTCWNKARFLTPGYDRETAFPYKIPTGLH